VTGDCVLMVVAGISVSIPRLLLLLVQQTDSTIRTDTCQLIKASSVSAVCIVCLLLHLMVVARHH